MPDRAYEFVQLDVFTQTPLAGNPLAIFTDARGLDDDEIQALAREMNLSETSPHLHCRGGVAVCRASDARYGAAFVSCGVFRAGQD